MTPSHFVLTPACLAGGVGAAVLGADAGHVANPVNRLRGILGR